MLIFGLVSAQILVGSFLFILFIFIEIELRVVLCCQQFWQVEIER